MFYKMAGEEVLEAFDSSIQGLNESQVQINETQYGKNQLTEEERQGIFIVFLSQFKDLLVFILIIAAVISAFTGNVESTLVIFAVIILNAILGTVQHFKAEKSLNSLKKLASPMARVRRAGKRVEIVAADIVAGDILLLEAGDMVPADGRILECFSLQVNESALTGESESITKTTSPLEGHLNPADQLNMVFSGTQVTYGRAVVVVTKTGMNTELGKIAQLMNETEDRKTPLQISLDSFGKKLSFLVLAICVVILMICIYRGMTIVDSLMFAVALAVAAIPEALSSIVTISLALGTTKMAKESAIMKNLKSVESLGCVSIICSDKTGTLTKNKMTVMDTFLSDKGQESLDRLFLACNLCNDSVVTAEKSLGDPTEIALTEFCMHTRDDYEQIRQMYPRLAEVPFDSDRKLMSTLHKIGVSQIMLTKGAPDVLLKYSKFIYSNGFQRTITEQDIETIRKQNYDFSSKGLRVLGFAQKIVDRDHIQLEDEQDFAFIGLVAMMDPPRDEAKTAVADCARAGIMPIMITGDHKVTASAIAKSIGLLHDEQKAVTGEELDDFSDQELERELSSISVYARVTPAHKIRIVDAWQKRGNIVAMTGDGVNDAPALKKADIGIAMGITGTDVSKDAASMILTDDNFATIIKAVANGRNIYNNIKNSIKFLLSGNTSGILAVLYTSLLALPIPFTAVHLLFINLITDSLPAIAISMEKPTDNLLEEPPRDVNESILTRRYIYEVSIQGFLIACFTLIAYHRGLTYSAEIASTMAFATLCFARLWHGFNSRGKQSIFKLGLFSNVFSIAAFVLGTCLLFSVLLIPGIHGLFEVEDLSYQNLLFMIGCAVSPTILIQLVRLIKEQFRKARV